MCCQSDHAAGWAEVVKAVAAKCACAATAAGCATECADSACAGKTASPACVTCLQSFARTEPPPQCAKDGISECMAGADCGAYFACSGKCN